MDISLLISGEQLEILCSLSARHLNEETMSSDLRQAPPNFSIEQAKTIAKTIYGLDRFVRVLPSERDQNFLFERPDDEKFILKISNLDDEFSVLEMQNLAIEWVKSEVKVIRTLKGDLLDRYENHFIRLITFLPGQPLGTYPNPSLKLFFTLGELLGKVDHSLDRFDHPAARRSLYWDIQNAPMIIQQYKDRIVDHNRRQMIEKILQDWLNEVTPSLSSLRMSIIHNDANEYNIIVQDEDTLHLIDYGDMCYTYTVCEVAIGCAYAMLNQVDPIRIAREILRGYQEVYPLEHLELQLLSKFIRMRLAMSVTISTYQKSLQPDNDYLQISEKPAWTLLERLENIVDLFHE